MSDSLEKPRRAPPAPPTVEVATSFAPPALPRPTPWLWYAECAVLPVTKHRLCLDYFLSHAGYVFLIVTFLYAALAVVLGAGVSYYFFATAVVTLVMLVMAWYGEAAIGWREPGHVYVFAVAQGLLALGLVWAVGAGYVHLRQGKEWIEEEWYALSTSVLPFTTLLDFKASFESNAVSLLALGLISATLTLATVAEAWTALGGALVVMEPVWATALPEAAAVLCLSGASASFAIYGATIAAWSGPSPVGINALLWHGAWSVLAALYAGAVLVLPAAWGNGFLTHAALAAAAAPPALVLFVTSLVVQGAGMRVDAFVQSHWADLQLFVPAAFQGGGWDKYAEACYTPMEEAALTGMMAALALVAACGYHAWAAAAEWSVGPALAAARARLIDAHGRILEATVMGEVLAPVGLLAPTAVGAPRGGWAGAGDAAEGARAASAAAPHSRFRAAGADASLAGALKSAVGLSRGGGYGTLPGGDGGAPLLSASAAAAGGAAAAAASSTGGDSPAAAAAAAGDAAAAAAVAAGLSPAPYRGGAVAAAHIRAKVAASQQYTLLLVARDRILAPVGQRVRSPACGEGVRAAAAELRALPRGRRGCATWAALAALAAVAGLAGGLAQVTKLGACGALGYAPATRSYGVAFTLEAGQDRGYSPVVVQHSFPFGIVELVNTQVEKFPDITRRMTINVTAYAVDGARLPSADALARFVVVSSNCLGPDPLNDDDIGGCVGANVTVAPSSSFEQATRDCLAVRVTITTVVPAVKYAVTSRAAYVNVAGNAVEFVDAILKSGGGPVSVSAPFAQELVVTTDTASVRITDGYVARYLDVPPALPPSLVVRTGSGRVWLSNTVAQAIDVRAGGTITTETVLSASASCSAICGNIALAATGRARVILTQLLAAYNVAVSSDAGAIIAVNAGIDVALDISFTSATGPVTLSNFLQLHSNNTIVRTGGSVSASAVFANVLDIAVADESKVAVTVGFVGLPAPDPADTTDIPFNPKFMPGQNYSYPGLYISSDRGDVTVLSLSGDPRAAVNSATGSLVVRTNAGDVKVQIGGGGMVANYSLSAPRGSVRAEVEGLAVAPTGQLGSGSDPKAKNVISLRSNLGNVQMSELPSPL